MQYFSHDANASGRHTCKTLTRHWGNDGYAAWFRLLELLASEEGHFIDYTGSKREWVIDELYIEDGDKADAIIQKLADVGAIDKELWEKEKIIWSGNLIKRIMDVYKNRRREIPCRPTSNIQETYDKLGLSYEQHRIGDISDNGSRPKDYKGKYGGKKGKEADE